MAEIRSLPALARRYYPLQFLLFGLCVVAFGFLFFRASTRDGTFYAFLALFVVSGLATLVIDRWLLRRVACPECGVVMVRERAPRGKFISVQYHCPKCDILWDADAPVDATGQAERYSDPLK